MDNRLATIATFPQALLAHAAKNYLAQQGMRAFVADEFTTVQSWPVYIEAKPQVPLADAQRRGSCLPMPGNRLTTRRHRRIQTMPFDLRPTLRGKLVELRPLAPTTSTRCTPWPPIRSCGSNIPVGIATSSRCFGKFFAEALACGGALAAINLADSRMIGSSRFDRYDEGRSEIEIGWTFLARSHWGGPYNREMKRLMLQHAFRFVRRVVFSVGSGNIRSQQAVEKIGGHPSGSRVRSKRPDDADLRDHRRGVPREPAVGHTSPTRKRGSLTVHSGRRRAALPRPRAAAGGYPASG